MANDFDGGSAPSPSRFDVAPWGTGGGGPTPVAKVVPHVSEYLSTLAGKLSGVIPETVNPFSHPGHIGELGIPGIHYNVPIPATPNFQTIFSGPRPGTMDNPNDS